MMESDSLAAFLPFLSSPREGASLTYDFRVHILLPRKGSDLTSTSYIPGINYWQVTTTTCGHRRDAVTSNLGQMLPVQGEHTKHTHLGFVTAFITARKKNTDEFPSEGIHERCPPQGRQVCCPPPACCRCYRKECFFHHRG